MTFAGARVAKVGSVGGLAGPKRGARSCGARRVVTRAKVREIFMPALSSTMTEGKIVSWLKNSGDKISKGESIVVVESDKADMDVETFYDGFIGSIVVPDGATAAVGEPIAYIAESEADLEEAKSKAGAGAPAAAAAPPAAEPEPAAPPAPEPAAAPAPAAPAPAAAAPPPPAPAAPAPVKRADGRVIATPYAKKLAKELGVDLSTIGGSGPNGRITASDVEMAKSGSAPAPAAAAPAAAPAAAAPAPVPAKSAAPPAPAAPSGDGEIQPFTSLQAAVSKNMEASLTVPTYGVAYTITTDSFDALYKRLKPKGVTMTALLSKAVAVALAKHPIMYAACTPAGDGIVYNEAINIAVAVAMPDGGLITPVLKDAATTDIYQLSRNWGDLVSRARSKQLAPDEYSTGTFTISNLGMFGVDKFDSILPVGTGAIMAVGGSKPTVVATEDGKIGVEKQMTVNVTADHRIIYGADVAEFLGTLKSVIENPDDLTM